MVHFLSFGSRVFDFFCTISSTIFSLFYNEIYSTHCSVFYNALSFYGLMSMVVNLRRLNYRDRLHLFRFKSYTLATHISPALCRRLMPCPFTGPKMFCAGPNFLRQPKNLFTYCGSHKHFVPDKKMICIQ